MAVVAPLRSMSSALAASRRQIHAAAGGGIAAPGRTAQRQRLAGDHAEFVVALHEGELVHHPGHDLRGGVDVGGRHVLLQAEDAPHLADISPAQALQFTQRQRLGVADDAALAAAQGDIHHGALPGHPGRQGADGVDRLAAVEADAALVGAAGVVVLDAETVEDLGGAVVHVHRQRDVQLAQGPAQQFVHSRVQLQEFCGFVQLPLRHLERIEPFFHFLCLSDHCFLLLAF